MATDPTPSGVPHPFDVKTVEHLIGLMAQHDLTEIALQEGDHRIRIRKGGPAPILAPGYPPPMAFPPPAVASAATFTPAPVADTPAKKFHEIKSEMVGTFYAKPKPDKDDYVKVGTKLKPETIICQIEAMKIFNEIPAGVAGTIAEVCVKNGEPVDFGMVLFRVDPS